MLFSEKTKMPHHPLLRLNEEYVQEAYTQQAAVQKNSFLILDCQLSFKEHIKTVLSKVNITIETIHIWEALY